MTATGRAGLLLGALGVLGFSFSLPATRLAVTQGLDPWFVAFGRAAVAAVLAAVVLSLARAPRPTRAQARRLAVVALGVVVGFPLSTSLALETTEASHGGLVIAVLPAVTAVAAVLRAGERPSGRFWPAALAGLAIVLAFALVDAGGAPTAGDLLLLAGVVACGVGYAEGGALARELGGARTICWALVVAAPATFAITAVSLALAPPSGVATTGWLGFAYVSVVSMFLGFFAWYAGLARGGVARVGQVQLAQPLLTVALSALVLGEAVGVELVLAAVAVLACVAVTQRARVDVARCHPPGGGAPQPGQPEGRRQGLRQPVGAAWADAGAGRG